MSYYESVIQDKPHFFGTEISKMKVEIDAQQPSVEVGYKRVMEKIKELRQNFCHGVNLGSRSGSERLVFEIYICGGQLVGCNIKQATQAKDAVNDELQNHLSEASDNSVDPNSPDPGNENSPSEINVFCQSSKNSTVVTGKRRSPEQQLIDEKKIGKEFVCS